MPKRRKSERSDASVKKENKSLPIVTPAPSTTSAIQSSRVAYVVDTIFPKRELHIIGGPAHGGKTMLTFHIMDTWSQHLNVFGYPSRPAPFCYVACNHSLDACREAARCSGMTVNVPMVSLVDFNCAKSFKSVLDCARQEVSNVQVIFLDGILYIAGSSGLDNAAVGEFLSDMIRVMKEENVTVIATGRCAKPKEARSNVRSIDRFLGATAWTELSSTFIAIEPKNPTNPKSDKRIVTIMPKRSAAFALSYRFSGDGKLTEVSDDGSADSPERLEEIIAVLEVHSAGSRIATSDMLELGRDLGIVARSSMMNYLLVLVRQGRLLDGGHGWYVIPQVQ